MRRRASAPAVPRVVAMVLALGLASPPSTFAAEEIPRHWGRDRLVDLEHVKIAIEVDLVARSISGAAEITVRAMHDGTTRAELMAHHLDVRRVLVDGRELAARGTGGWSHDGEILSLSFETPLLEDDRRVVRVEYSATPQDGLYFVGDRAKPATLQCWSQGEQEENHSWFPVHDDPAERITSETLVTVARPYSVVGNGRLLAVTDEPDGRRTFHHRLDFPHAPYLVSVAVGDWATTTGSWEGVELSYHVPKDRAADAARTFARTPAILAFLSSETGVKYPYPAYRQVAVSEYIYGGMENIAATTLTDETLHGERAHHDWPSDGLVAHEAAHQWFGDYVTCRDWSDAWLNEGFATYYAALAMGELEGPDQLVVELDGMRKGAIESDERKRRPIVTNRYRSSDELFDGHAYSKGGMVLHALRRELGDDLYRRSIQAWLVEHAGTSADTHDLVETIERVTGRDVSRFFDQWIRGAGEPDLRVKWTWDADERDCAVTVRQAQAGEASDGEKDRAKESGRSRETAIAASVGLFDVPLDVEILRSPAPGKATGEVQVDHHAVRVDGDEETFHFECATRPDAVLVDPQGWLIRKLKVERPRAETIAVLRSAPFLLARLEAARQLADDAGQPAALDALAAMMAPAQPWPLRRACAEALSEAGTPAARDTLLAALQSEQDSRVRRAVAKALGGYSEPQVARALEDALAKDASWAVEADAADALGEIELPEEQEAGEAAIDRALEAALSRRSHREEVFQSAIAALRKRRATRVRDLALQWSTPGTEHPRRARQAAIAQLGEIAAREPDERRRGVIRERLEAILRERDVHLRVRGAALDALVKSRDRESLPAIRTLATSASPVLTRNHAARAAADLEKAAAADARVEDLQRQLDEERRERTKIEERLRKIEARLPAERKKGREEPEAEATGAGGSGSTGK